MFFIELVCYNDVLSSSALSLNILLAQIVCDSRNIVKTLCGHALNLSDEQDVVICILLLYNTLICEASCR